MGIKLGGGGSPAPSYLMSESAAPSGRLQVLESKDFPYLHTGKSLVFVIARNGMVWGKRLDKQSSKGDIELEVFWPREDGCLVRQCTGLARDYGVTVQVTLQSQLALKMFSREQERKIESILSQKEIIQYELGTLMVRPGTDTTDPNFKQALPYLRMDKTIPLLRYFSNEPCSIKVVDCSYGNKWQTSSRSSWDFWYDDATFDFKFSSQYIELRKIGSRNNPISYSDISKHESNFDNGDTGIVKKFFAAKLSGGKFDMSGVKLRGNSKINPYLRIMYGEYDFFEYFEVDDAVFILEEETISAGTPKLFWTLGIAQNKHVREMMRLASNNPGLFAPLIPRLT